MKTNQSKKNNSVSKVLMVILLIAAVIFAIATVVNFANGMNVKSEYHNSSYSSVNAYVGGDAYNYIINGTYFTGYSVMGSGCMVCAAMCGVGAALIAVREKGKKDSAASDKDEKATENTVIEDIESELPEI